ncbi:unnamed protein product, partial [Rotaria sp. Silwood1]
MNRNSMNNGTISVEHLLAEQHPHADNEQRENSIENQSNSTRLANDTKKITKLPMVSTPLEYLYWSRYRFSRAIGVMMVCFNLPKVT